MGFGYLQVIDGLYGGGSNIAGTVVSTGWHHLAAVQDIATDQRRIYVDGVLVGSGSPRDSDGVGNLVIGAADGVNEFFQGILDEVRIYNRNLSDSEISLLSSGFIPP